MDASGNVYATGEFRGTVDFDPGPGTTNLTSAGYTDVFILKLNASGDFIWAKSFGNFDSDFGICITLDASENIYTIGNFPGTVDFDPGPATTNLTSTGLNDIFIQKLDNSGNFLWAKSFGSSGYSDKGTSIAVDASGNVYSTGNFQGTVDFDPGPGTANITATAYQEIFIQKLDASGNFLWVKSFKGGYYDEGSSITVNASGDVYVTGHFGETVDFDPGVGTANLTSAGVFDAFVVKLDSSGNYIWAKSFGGSLDDQAKSLQVDASGNVYTTGIFTGTVDFDPGAGTAHLTSEGGADIFVQKLDATGSFVWAKSFGGSPHDFGLSIAVDGSGNVYTTGQFEDTVDFDPGAGTANLTSVGDFDVFVQKMSQEVTGIVDVGKGIQIKTYPNPSKGLVHLTFEQAVNNVAITLTDITGKVVFSKHLDATVNEHIHIDGAAGIYFLHVKTPQGQSVVKLVKE